LGRTIEARDGFAKKGLIAKIGVQKAGVATVFNRPSILNVFAARRFVVASGVNGELGSASVKLKPGKEEKGSADQGRCR
jgi:hypothetical protein